jgi:hypothetical protein
MYDTQYNRKIANEIDHINKNFIKHNKNLEGAGFMNYLPMLLAGMSGMGHAQTGQQEYVKAKGGSKKQSRMCPHCEGSGVSGSGVSGSGVSGSGVSGSGVSGSGFKVSIGFGKKRGRKPKAQAPTEETPKENMEGGFGISFGFGKKRGRKPKQAPVPQQKDLDGGFGISFGFGKDGKKKRGNPNINKRAEIVKKVMKEQGLGMIQASQYVKAHNLY